MSTAQKTDKPSHPPYSGGEDESPKPQDNPHVPGEDVKEPPLPGTAPADEKFPRKGDVPRA
jgi:hypothetical protein